MSQLEKALQARIIEINNRIPGAKLAERRALQKERSDLEIKLEKVRSWA
jgi:hypothetical protein